MMARACKRHQEALSSQDPATLHWVLLLASVQQLACRLKATAHSTEHSEGDAPSRPLTTQHPTSTEASHTDSSQQRLQDYLLQLSPRAYRRLIIRLLESMGYIEVQSWRKATPTPLRHTLRGGAQLRAYLGPHTNRLKVLISLKRYGYPVNRRFVDELRGAMLRHEAQAGLLITTSAFPRAAKRAAQQDAQLPVRLIDGERLHCLLAEHGVGVEQLADGTIVPDAAFFRHLEAESATKTHEV